MTGAVVELCGLPGSGKTTLAAALAQQLSVRGVECRVADRGISAALPLAQRTAHRLWLASLVAAAHPGWAAVSARDFAHAGNESTRDTAATLVQWLATAGLSTAAHRAAGVSLLEEGPVQTAWTLLLRSRRSADGLDPRTLLYGLPTSARSDLVLVVDVPPQVAVARLASRTSRHSRTQLLPADERIVELRRGAVLLDLLLRAVPTPSYRLCVLPGMPPGELAAEAADAVGAALTRILA